MIFVDTNYFLRFLLQDINQQHLKAKCLFQKAAQGKVKLTTSTIVVFEIYWVLSSFYEKKRSQVAKVLKEVLRMDFIQFDQKKLLEKAVMIYQATNLDLEDSYNLVFAKKTKAKKFATFDQKLKKTFFNHSHPSP